MFFIRKGAKGVRFRWNPLLAPILNVLGRSPATGQKSLTIYAVAAPPTCREEPPAAGGVGP